jgi:hypothetical protein
VENNAIKRVEPETIRAMGSRLPQFFKPKIARQTSVQRAKLQGVF